MDAGCRITKTRFRIKCLIVFNAKQCQERLAKNCPKTAIVKANYKCPLYVCTVDPPTIKTTKTTTWTSPLTIKTTQTTKTTSSTFPPTVKTTKTTSSTSHFFTKIHTTVKSTLTKLVPTSSKMVVAKTVLKQTTMNVKQSPTISITCSSKDQFYVIWAIVSSCKLKAGLILLPND